MRMYEKYDMHVRCHVIFVYVYLSIYNLISNILAVLSVCVCVCVYIYIFLKRACTLIIAHIEVLSFSCDADWFTRCFYFMSSSHCIFCQLCVEINNGIVTRESITSVTNININIYIAFKYLSKYS